LVVKKWVRNGKEEGIKREMMIGEAKESFDIHITLICQS
jgi:hypothetical protein